MDTEKTEGQQIGHLPQNYPATLTPLSAEWKNAQQRAKVKSDLRKSMEGNLDEIDTKQQIKYGNTLQAACGIFTEYCEYSTIHGVRYFGERKRPVLERLFWVSVFLLSIYLCATLTKNIWDKWNNNPVIVSFAEKSTPVWEIPFPAVTVCPETKARQTQFNFTDMFGRLKNNKSLTDTEKFNLDAVAQVCEPHLLADFNYAEMLAIGKNLIHALEEVMPILNTTYLKCKWRNIPTACEEIFQKVVTEEGICYTFNSMSPNEVYREKGLLANFQFEPARYMVKDWNFEDGYSVDASPETFPKRVLGSGAKAGLSLVLNGLEKDFDYLCRGPVQGFKILLHTPGEVPQVSKQYFRIPFDQEVLISIKPQIITTSEGLRHYEPHRRQCYFQQERNLRFFNIYTQANCELECLANFTYAKCGCVKFSMPRPADIAVCGAANINCYNTAEDELLLKEFNQGMQTSQSNARGVTECNCLPSCTAIAYEAEISQADFDYKIVSSSLGQDDITDKFTDAKMSRLSLFFKEAQFLTSKRSELYGITDFLANCGGLLGLFMGVSTLSIVEIIYFCTLRLISNLLMRHKKRRELAKEGQPIKQA